MNQGINSDALDKDIIKLDYYNNEINKNLKEYYNIKKELENNYTSPSSQDEIDNVINSKIDMLYTNRNNVTNLLQEKIVLYKNVIKKTKDTFNKVENHITIE